MTPAPVFPACRGVAGGGPAALLEGDTHPYHGAMELLQEPAAEEPALSATTVFASLAELRDAPGYSPKAISGRLIKSLGADAAAPLLGVSAEVLDRWASGQEAPDADG